MTVKMLGKQKQIGAAVAVSLGALSQGMAMAFPSSALPQMTDPSSDFYLNDQQASLMVGVLMFSATFGNISSGVLMNIIGRRRVLLFCSVPIIVGFILIAAATDEIMLLIGRGLIGLTTGMTVPTCVVYISEIAEPKFRGVLLNLPLLLSGVGSLTEYLLGSMIYDWRMTTWIGLAIPICFFLSMLCIPDSPRYLLLKKQESKAWEALKKLREDSHDIMQELTDIRNHLQQSNPDESFKDNFLKPHNIKVYIYCLLLSIFFGGCGGTVFIAFIEPLCIEMNSPISPKLVTLIVGVILVVVPVLVLILANKVEPRMFLQVSGMLMTMSCLFLVSLYAVILPRFPDVVFLQYLPPLFLIAFMISFGLGYQTTALTIPSQISPLILRGFFTATAGTTAALTTASFSYAYIFMIKNLQLLGYFSVFMGISLFGTLFPTFFIPKTKGKTLEEIETIVQKKGIFMSL